MNKFSVIVAGLLGVGATCALMYGAYLLTPFGSERIIVSTRDVIGSSLTVIACTLFIVYGLPLIHKIITKFQNDV